MIRVLLRLSIQYNAGAGTVVLGLRGFQKRVSSRAIADEVVVPKALPSSRHHLLFTVLIQQGSAGNGRLPTKDYELARQRTVTSTSAATCFCCASAVK
ncbi:hypothetical protein LOAG_00312 [Loa loa]|uniref:Uncharacterized protein n=1 Tax=Loa loa TaxID=7209 RepID=A0A1S0UC45_LOALO|nr:hypothetical protein LOAG_00312 [Loa loa]EFO28179.1 hypothetical protein LOAG_00312 [Loa loa]